MDFVFLPQAELVFGKHFFPMAGLFAKQFLPITQPSLKIKYKMAKSILKIFCFSPQVTYPDGIAQGGEGGGGGAKSIDGKIYLFSYGLCSVENKAYSRHTWTNDKRHTWTKWKYGHSSLSVDGKENTNLPNCAILDNYDVDKVIYNIRNTYF